MRPATCHRFQAPRTGEPGERRNAHHDRRSPARSAAGPSTSEDHLRKSVRSFRADQALSARCEICAQSVHQSRKVWAFLLFSRSHASSNQKIRHKIQSAVFRKTAPPNPPPHPPRANLLFVVESPFICPKTQMLPKRALAGVLGVKPDGSRSLLYVRLPLRSFQGVDTVRARNASDENLGFLWFLLERRNPGTP